MPNITSYPVMYKTIERFWNTLSSIEFIFPRCNTEAVRKKLTGLKIRKPKTLMKKQKTLKSGGILIIFVLLAFRIELSMLLGMKENLELHTTARVLGCCLNSSQIADGSLFSLVEDILSLFLIRKRLMQKKF